MKDKNIFILNHKTIIEALQMYLNCNLITKNILVTKVGEGEEEENATDESILDGSSRLFKIEVSEKQEIKK